jgi:hypothetical protein
MRDILASTDADTVINCDETCWWYLPQGLTTWAKKGAKDVKIYHDMNDKANFTVLAFITAQRKKLGLQFIAHGKTGRSERSFGDVGTNFTSHTESGWTGVESFKDALRWLRTQPGYTEKHDGMYVKKLHLVLDVYKVHTTQAVKDLAEELNIELHYIPPGMTDACQPLDRAIFGVLKAKAKKAFREQFYQKSSIKMSKRLATELFLQCWDEVSDEALQRAWCVYDPPAA